MRDHDLTDEEIAAIQAESAAYDLAHPYWREEAEARRAAWRIAETKNRRPKMDPEIRQRMDALQERLRQKGKP